MTPASLGSSWLVRLSWLVCLSCLGQGSGAAAQEPPAGAPNVVVFLVDDMGWRDAGFLGSEFYETPHMDRLAAEGMVFTDAYANGPNCAPSRASLLTGLYTPRHGIYTVNNSARGKAANRRLIAIPNERVLAERFTTLAEALGEAGYASASIGKWHLGDDPTTQGFDVNVGGYAAGHPKSYFSPYRNPSLADGPEGEYLTDRLTGEALAFVRENRARPFFLYLTHYAVHTPIQSKEALRQEYAGKEPVGGHRNAKYAGMLASVDESLGRVLALLEELELSDDTLVCLFSDNGGLGSVTSMAPLRGAKGMLYEGGIRVPLVVRWPARVAGGARCAEPVIGLDLMPTLLDAAGRLADSELELDGRSLLPLLTGSGSLERDALYWHFPAYLEASRGMPGPWRTTPAGAIRSERYKLLEFFEDGRTELYDLAADPGESHDLARERPELADSLRARLAAWREGVGAPVPSEPNPHYVSPDDR